MDMRLISGKQRPNKWFLCTAAFTGCGHLSQNTEKISAELILLGENTVIRSDPNTFQMRQWDITLKSPPMIRNHVFTKRYLSELIRRGTIPPLP